LHFQRHAIADELLLVRKGIRDTNSHISL
jgi:hypothetical protein